MYLWKTQTLRTMIIDEMSNIKDMERTSGRQNIKNDNHRWYVKHYRHGMYLWKAQICRTMIIDEMMKVKDL